MTAPRRGADGLTPKTRWGRKLADWVVCPSCVRQWQRTNTQKSDDTRCCTARCAAHQGNVGRVRRANRDAVHRYKAVIAERLTMDGSQARDVEVLDIVRLMLDARREGIVLGRQRGAARRAPIRKRVA